MLQARQVELLLMDTASPSLGRRAALKRWAPRSYWLSLSAPAPWRSALQPETSRLRCWAQQPQPRSLAGSCRPPRAATPTKQRLVPSIENKTPHVLLACIHNAGRSQMAAAWFNKRVDEIKAHGISAERVREIRDDIRGRVVALLRDNGWEKAAG